MSSTLYVILFTAAGSFSITGAVLDWDSFMNSRHARLFVKLFGRSGARIFYVVLGVVIIVLGFVSAAAE